MIYIVSGFMRSGTSMMMRALEAGGLEAAFNPSRNEMNDRFGDENYKPNPGGFYELNREEYQQPGFPRGYEGKLLKLLYGGMSRIVACDYKVVFMRRDFEEMRQSYEGFFDRPLNHKEKDLIPRLEDCLGILRQRRDIDVTELWYRDVVEKPLKMFTALRDNGWPIDPQKSAEIVDPSLCRFRRENLEVGI